MKNKYEKKKSDLAHMHRAAEMGEGAVGRKLEVKHEGGERKVTMRRMK